jgi:hypothetical protein
MRNKAAKLFAYNDQVEAVCGIMWESAGQFDTDIVIGVGHRLTRPTPNDSHTEKMPRR